MRSENNRETFARIDAQILCCSILTILSAPGWDVLRPAMFSDVLTANGKSLVMRFHKSIVICP